MHQNQLQVTVFKNPNLSSKPVEKLTDKTVIPITTHLLFLILSILIHNN